MCLILFNIEKIGVTIGLLDHFYYNPIGFHIDSHSDRVDKFNILYSISIFYLWHWNCFFQSYCPFSIFLKDFSVTLKSNCAKTNGDRNEILIAHKLTVQRKKSKEIFWPEVPRFCVCLSITANPRFWYHLRSAGCGYVCIYPCGHRCPFDCSHTIQPTALKLWHNIPHVLWLILLSFCPFY